MHLLSKNINTTYEYIYTIILFKIDFKFFKAGDNQTLFTVI